MQHGQTAQAGQGRGPSSQRAVGIEQPLRRRQCRPQLSAAQPVALVLVNVCTSPIQLLRSPQHAAQRRHGRLRVQRLKGAAALG